MKTVEVCLPYFKQGDDLAECVAGATSHKNALKLHANMLRGAAGILEQIYEVVGDTEIEISADTHCIFVNCEDSVADCLIDLGLAYLLEFEGEEDCDA